MSKNILIRLNRFVKGTTRGRRMVKSIRLNEKYYEEYKECLLQMQRYPVEEWGEVGQLWFKGIPVYKKAGLKRF